MAIAAGKIPIKSSTASQLRAITDAELLASVLATGLLSASAVNMVPSADRTLTLGTTTKRWNALYLGLLRDEADTNRIDITSAITYIVGRSGAGVSLDGNLGFYGSTPIAQQTGVAVSAAGIHAALVNLGLITA